MFYFDPTFILVIPAMILAFYAQARVSGTFKKYSKDINRRGYTGADVATMLLSQEGIRDVRVERVQGNLTDHYDPKEKVLRLSESVYDNKSIAALGVAAHETGHAIQHANEYTPLRVRNSILPSVMIGSSAAFPLIFLGFILSSFVSLGLYIVYFGIALFGVVLLFQIVTLPVEFNASSRAINLLSTNHFLDDDELVGAKKVLSAAALTYIAAVAVSLSQIIRFLVLANSRRD